MANLQLDLRFWDWLRRGSGAGPGYRRVLDWWLVLHLLCGLGLGVAAVDCLKEISRAVLLPLAGVLVGLAFAWAGNAQALLQTEQIQEMTNFRVGGFAEYVYTYQLAILVLLVTLSFWGLCAIGIWDDRWPRCTFFWPYLAVKTIAFGMLSLSIRECWHVVLGAQLMLILRRNLTKPRSKSSE